MIAVLSTPRFSLRPGPRLETSICLCAALGAHVAVLLALDGHLPNPPRPEPIMIEVIVPQPSAPTAEPMAGPMAQERGATRASPRSHAESQRSLREAKPHVVKPAAIPAPKPENSATAESSQPDAARNPDAAADAMEPETQRAQTPAAATAPQGRTSAPEGPTRQSVETIAPRFDAPHLRNPKAEYPRLARRMGEQGRVVMRVYVSSAGLPERLELQTSSGSPRLDQAAREAVARWRFVPARRGSEAVGAWLLVPIVFRLED